MNIVVLNGSPKGDLSITLQSVRFIQKKFLQHEFKIFNVAQDIKKIEENHCLLRNILDDVKSSDGVLWVFSVHFFLVPSQYKRFIEVIIEKNATDVFKNKYTASLSTSIHFYDHTAHNYIHAICDDMEMKYTGSFSADMQDLLKDKEREKLINFAKDFFDRIKDKTPTSKFYVPIKLKNTIYSISRDVKNKICIDDKKIIVVTDCIDAQSNLYKMTEKIKDLFSRNIEIVNLENVDIKGGCLGCLHCALDNICVYHGKDGFADMYDSIIKKADIIIIAGTIKDRYLSSTWKMFFDRTFYHTFIPALRGKQIGFIISGPLREIPDIREIFTAYAECEEANLVDFVTDEYESSLEIDALIRQLAEQSVRFSNEKYIKPPTFLGVGGMKIFRDDTWGRFRFILQANYKFYKKHGRYDFPQKDLVIRLKNLVMMCLTKIPAFRDKFEKKLNEELIKPYLKILEG